MSEKVFKIGQAYTHATGKRMKIVGSAATCTYGLCLVGENINGGLAPVGNGDDGGHFSGWKLDDDSPLGFDTINYQGRTGLTKPIEE